MGFDGIDGIGWDWDLVGIGHCLGWDAAPGDWGLLIGGWGVGDERQVETYKWELYQGRVGAVFAGVVPFCRDGAVFAGMMPVLAWVMLFLLGWCRAAGLINEAFA